MNNDYIVFIRDLYNDTWEKEYLVESVNLTSE